VVALLELITPDSRILDKSDPLVAYDMFLLGKVGRGKVASISPDIFGKIDWAAAILLAAGRELIPKFYGLTLSLQDSFTGRFGCSHKRFSKFSHNLLYHPSLCRESLICIASAEGPCGCCG